MWFIFSEYKSQFSLPVNCKSYAVAVMVGGVYLSIVTCSIFFKSLGSLFLNLFLVECYEQDACHQYSLCINEG